MSTPSESRATRRAAPHVCLAVVALTAASLTGCAAQRTLSFTSDPSGAQVRLDDDLVGTTPCEVPFLHYGTRRVTYYLDDYRTRSFLVEVRPPWYARFPFDIVSEVLIPVGWKDRKRIHAEMESGIDAADAPTRSSVLDRAEALRRAGPNGPRHLPPVEIVPALPEPAAPVPADPSTGSVPAAPPT